MTNQNPDFASWPYPQSHGFDCLAELRQWSPSTAADEWNRGFVPLKPRPGVGNTPGNPSSPSLVDQPRLLQCYNMSGPQVAAPDGGYLPVADLWPQGVPNQSPLRPENIYIQPWWQHIDVFVYFGHHMVMVPTPWWINAAHRNGVPVLGTFGSESGLSAEIMKELLCGPSETPTATSADGTVVPYYAARFMELAAHYGFDGWFFNIEIETGIGQELVQPLISFLDVLTQKMPTPRQIHWYDAVDSLGNLNYQNDLDDKNKAYFAVCNGIFPNYWWFPGDGHLKTSVDTASQMHRSPYDVYTGIQAFNSGEPGGDGGQFNTGASVEKCVESGTSAGLFAVTWSYQEAPMLEPSAPLGYPVYDDYIRRDEKVWMGGTSGAYRGSLCGGVGAAIAARPCPEGLPFVTHFNTGNGKASVIEGEVVAATGFGHISQQELLPTWRFLLGDDGSSVDAFQIGFADDLVFTGGTSLRMATTSSAIETMLRLYAVCLPVQGDLFAAYAVHDDGLPVALVLTLNDGATVRLAPPGATEGVAPSAVVEHAGGWTLRQYRLGSKHSGKTIIEIGILMERAGQSVGAHLGQIQLVPTAEAPSPPNPVDWLASTPATEWVTLPDGSTALNVTLRWAAPVSDDIAWFEVYRTDIGTTPIWLGRAYAFAYCAIVVPAGATTVDFAVLAVSTAGARQEMGKAATISVSVPQI